jgi:hypothetical protein
LDELVEVITAWPVGMPVRAMEQVLARGESAVPALSAALERWRADEERDLLWPIVLLGETRTPSAISVLVDQVQRTEEEELAQAASEGLAKIGAASIPAILQIADSLDAVIRLHAYAALGWIADERCFATLVNGLRRDLELGDALAQALCDHGRREAIAHLYDAYQACASWQRIEFENAIRDLHFGLQEPFLWTRNWRARYRREPLLGTFELGWHGVSVLVRRHAEAISKRVAPPLKSFEEILKEQPDSKGSVEVCERCSAPIERTTGVPVCPETALWAAVYQARFLGEAREGGMDDFFDLFDDLDDMLWDHYEKKEALANSRKKRWSDEGEELEMRRQTCHWLVEQGIDDIGAGRALLLAKALELADRFGDPEGLLSPVKRIPKSAPKTGRNEPCPCGSGLKYKRCCLGKVAKGASRSRQGR